MLVLGSPKAGRSTLCRFVSGGAAAACVVTASACGMRRSAGHVAKRASCWHVYEECVKVAECVRAVGCLYDVVVVDGLAAWVACLVALGFNAMLEVDKLLMALKAATAKVVVVSTLELASNSSLAARSYNDLLSVANQQLARKLARVYLLVCGLKLRLK
ncbi:putative adenosylcobinamide kinase [Candidatus Hodgkinia cicadicola Dsem]|nr:putative adenosylcobinamide kinase [Candidatus Hodgkinia cicadicola Dsem]